MKSSEDFILKLIEIVLKNYVHRYVLAFVLLHCYVIMLHLLTVIMIEYKYKVLFIGLFYQ